MEKGKIVVFVILLDGGNVRGWLYKCWVKKGVWRYMSLCYNCNENGYRMKKCLYVRCSECVCYKCGV